MDAAGMKVSISACVGEVLQTDAAGMKILGAGGKGLHDILFLSDRRRTSLHQLNSIK